MPSIPLNVPTISENVWTNVFLPTMSLVAFALSTSSMLSSVGCVPLGSPICHPTLYSSIPICLSPSNVRTQMSNVLDATFTFFRAFSGDGVNLTVVPSPVPKSYQSEPHTLYHTWWVNDSTFLSRVTVSSCPSSLVPDTDATFDILGILANVCVKLVSIEPKYHPP